MATATQHGRPEEPGTASGRLTGTMAPDQLAASVQALLGTWAAQDLQRAQQKAAVQPVQPQGARCARGVLSIFPHLRDAMRMRI